MQHYNSEQGFSFTDFLLLGYVFIKPNILRFLFNYGFSNITKFQRSGLPLLSLKPINSCKMKKIFQLAVDAAALK